MRPSQVERPDRVKLTKRVVEAAQPRDKAYYVADGGAGAISGFAVRVHPTGKKTFALRYRPDGRNSAETVQAIGEFGPMTVEEARRLALQLRADVTASRIDPARDPRTARRNAKAAKAAEREAITVAELFDLFLADAGSRQLKPGTLAFLRAHLGVHTHLIGPRKGEAVLSPLRAALGHLKAKDVTRKEVKAFYDAQREITPAAARRSVKELGSAFRFGCAEGLLPAGTSPAERVRLARMNPPRRAALSEDQYAALGRALQIAVTVGLPTAPTRKARTRGISKVRAAKLTGKKRGSYERHTPTKPRPYNRVTAACLRFLAVSGWRKSEAQTLRWDALDAGGHSVTLGDTKTGVSVRPLGKSAWQLLEAERARQAGAGIVSEFVFPRQLDPSKPISDLVPLWTNAADAASLSITLHGLRHSFVTVARGLGYGDHVIAALVGHKLGATQTGRYGLAPGDVVTIAAEATNSAIARLLGLAF